MVKWQYWECQVCKDIVKLKTQSIKADVEAHLETHVEAFQEYKQQEAAYYRAVCEAERTLQVTFPKATLGAWMKNITDTNYQTKRRMWTCPICKQELTYHKKRYHENNRVKFCPPSEEYKSWHQRHPGGIL